MLKFLLYNIVIIFIVRRTTEIQTANEHKKKNLTFGDFIAQQSVQQSQFVFFLFLSLCSRLSSINILYVCCAKNESQRTETAEPDCYENQQNVKEKIFLTTKQIRKNEK